MKTQINRISESKFGDILTNAWNKYYSKWDFWAKLLLVLAVVIFIPYFWL